MTECQGPARTIAEALGILLDRYIFPLHNFGLSGKHGIPDNPDRRYFGADTFHDKFFR